ncbi:hypothetical protein J437_LFUL018986 [Ladona fulva]|uniref:PiggyBac transposable element-derived protein domain-containing protein n=1 Tax=Ladona fulva TaxID=123851 RepID=A0A8K0PC61_LADFU|nr:hypothetical protein J437_LFUL018986 [Ladona fulva]
MRHLLPFQESHSSEFLLYLDSPFQKSHIAVWKTLEKCEFQVWLGLLFHVGHIQINCHESYWRTDPLYSIPIFAEKMSRNRFLLIMQALHFAENPLENQQEPADRLFKNSYADQHFSLLLFKIMRDVEYPNKNLSLDESMVLWQCLIFPQYIQGKKHKHGIKIYMLTELSSLVLQFHIYAGSAD